MATPAVPWSKPRLPANDSQVPGSHAPGLTRRDRRDQRQRRAGRWSWVRFVVASFAFTLVAAVTAGATVAYTAYAGITRDLPSLETLNLRERSEFQTTKIYDRNGVLLYEFVDPTRGKRVEVPLQRVPKPVVNAFLAAEDGRFYQNPGVDLRSIARAFYENHFSESGQVQGASTITQQLVKNAVLTNEQTFERKAKEAILALQITKRYSKDQILELYLNSVHFGGTAYGIEAASETYFGKPVEQLTLPEGAVLAGLVRSPSATNPFQDEQAAKAEQRRVLDAMVLHGFLNQAAAEQAAAEPLQYSPALIAEIKAPHFVFWVRDLLEADPKFGKRALYDRGLAVTTTLDIRMQEMAELIVREHVSRLNSFHVTNGALVAINPATGEVLAMAGSADYANKAIHGEVNVALAQRQPGSSIKPITYLAAMMKGWGPATIIEDEATTFPGYPPYAPRNYDGKFHGKVTVRTALSNSFNIPAVKALQHVTIPAMFDLGRQMGITSFQEPQKYGLAATLGGSEVRLLDLTAAYGVLANQGQRVAPVAILKVADLRGGTLDRYTGPKPTTVVDPARAYMITSILADNDARAAAFGPDSPLKLSRPAAAKTGTTDNYHDNWTIGYTSQIVTGVWVGNADNTPMRGTTGITGAAPIWHDFMEYAIAPLLVDSLDPPPGLVRITVGRESGKLWKEGCSEPKVEDFFLVGSAPRELCERPSPTPTFTAAPTTPTPWPTTTPWPTYTPGPSVDELRARVAGTATAGADAFATRMAQLRSSTPAGGTTGRTSTPNAASASATTAANGTVLPRATATTAGPPAGANQPRTPAAGTTLPTTPVYLAAQAATVPFGPAGQSARGTSVATSPAGPKGPTGPTNVSVTATPPSAALRSASPRAASGVAGIVATGPPRITATATRWSTAAPSRTAS